MIRQRDIRRFQARYHRNGVAGEGFHLCEFLYLRGAATVEMRAVLFEAAGHCAVMSTASIADRWRGDDFEPALREALAAAEKAQPEKLYSIEVE